MIQSVGKTIVGIGILTLLLLFYVHEQIALVRVSYLIDSKSIQLNHLSEQYRQIKFEVDQLKAPHLLQEKMKNLSMQLTLPQEIHVIKIPPLKITPQDSQVSPVASLSGNMFHFLGHWVDVAQAKTDNESTA